jgi:hypothetical protein
MPGPKKPARKTLPVRRTAPPKPTTPKPSITGVPTPSESQSFGVPPVSSSAKRYAGDFTDRFEPPEPQGQEEAPPETATSTASIKDSGELGLSLLYEGQMEKSALDYYVFDDQNREDNKVLVAVRGGSGSPGKLNAIIRASMSKAARGIKSGGKDKEQSSKQKQSTKAVTIEGMSIKGSQEFSHEGETYRGYWVSAPRVRGNPIKFREQPFTTSTRGHTRQLLQSPTQAPLLHNLIQNIASAKLPNDLECIITDQGVFVFERGWFPDKFEGFEELSVRVIREEVEKVTSKV